MSLAGLRKQFNKANQYMSEKIGGAEATKLDEDFLEMERKIDVTNELVEEFIQKTKEYLQPNPASRAKLMAVNSFSKLRGQSKNTAYPQPEGNLGDIMIKYGSELGDDSRFGQALMEAGDAMKQLADIKYALEDNVKQNLLEPLNHLQNKDLKEVMHHRKKLQGRRLDFDCKKRKQAKGAAPGSNVTDEEIRMAEEKFDESKSLAETAMFNLLDNDVEQISQLTALSEAQLEYHRQAVDILERLVDSLQNRKNEATSRPRQHRAVPTRVSLPVDDPFDIDNAFNGAPPSYNASVIHKSNKPVSPVQHPCCKALYDFDPENDGELGFKEGDIINLISRIDENWFEGAVHGRTGYFPVNYVDVIVDVH